MITAASASPTLSLVIRAPEALNVIALLRLGIRELKAETAGLGVNFGAATTAGVARLEAQVNELTAALATSKLELTQIQQKLEQTSARGVKAVQAEQAAIITKNRVAREEAKKTAQVEEEANLRRLSASETALAKLTRLPITSVEPNTKQRLTGDSLSNLENETGINRAAAARRAAEQAQQLALHRITEAEYVRIHAQALAENAIIDRAANARRTAEQNQQLAQHRLNEASYVRAHAEASAQNAAIDRAAEVARRRAIAGTNEFTEAQRNAHSAVRGLAGGFGMLWLSYGSIIPLAAGLAIAASFRESVKAGAEFQYQMEFTRAIIDETAEHAKDAGTEFKKMAGDSQFSAVQISQGARILGQAGFTTFRDIIATLPSVLKLATVGELEVAQAAEIAAGNMNAFGLTVNEIPNISNSLAKAAVLSATNIKEMGEALKQAGTIAQQAGININDMNAILSILATRNIRGQAAGTALANMIRELIAPSEKGREALKRIGVDAIDPLTGKMKAAVPLMQEFFSTLRQFDPQSQLVITNEIFNNRASKAFITGMDEAMTRLPQFRAEIGKAYDEAKFLDGVMEKLSHTFKFTLKEAVNTLQNAFIEAFEGSDKELTQLAKTAKDLFADQGFKDFLSGVVSGFANIADYALKAASALSQVWKVMAALKTLQEEAAGGNSGLIQPFWTRFFEGIEILAKKARELLNSFSAAIVTEAEKRSAFGSSGMSASEGAARANAARFVSQKGAAGTGGGGGTLKFTTPSKTIGAEKADLLSEVNSEVRILEQSARYTKAIYDKQRQFELITEEDFQEKVELLERDKITRMETITRQGLDQLYALEKEAANKIIGLQQWKGLTQEQMAEASAKREELNAQQIRIRTSIRELQDRQKQLASEANHQVALAKIGKEGREKQLNDKQLASIFKLKSDAGHRLEKQQEQFDISLMPEYEAAQVRERLAVAEQFYSRIRDLQVDIAKAQREAGPDQTKKVDSLKAELQVVRTLQTFEERRAAAQLRKNYDEAREMRGGIRRAVRDYSDAAFNDAANYGRAVTNIFKNAEEVLTDFFMTGKAGFREFATFAVRELVRIQVAKRIAGVSDFVSGLFGPADKVATHSGGIVGIEHSFSRRMELPRFHGGGIVGDEQMVIARKQEGIFTPAQMRAMAPVGSGDSFVVNINVTNNGGATPDADVSGGPAALAQRLRAVVVDEIIQQRRPGGALSR